MSGLQDGAHLVDAVLVVAVLLHETLLGGEEPQEVVHADFAVVVEVESRQHLLQLDLGRRRLHLSEEAPLHLLGRHDSVR